MRLRIGRRSNLLSESGLLPELRSMRLSLLQNMSFHSLGNNDAK